MNQYRRAGLEFVGIGFLAGVVICNAVTFAIIKKTPDKAISDFKHELKKSSEVIPNDQIIQIARENYDTLTIKTNDTLYLVSANKLTHDK